MLFFGKKILLSKRAHTNWMDGSYSLVSGHVEHGESVTQAMIREAKEEINISITKENLTPATVIHRNSDVPYYDFFFVCNKWEGTPIIAEPEYCDELIWADLDQLPQKLLPHIEEAISNYQLQIPFSESGWDYHLAKSTTTKQVVKDISELTR